MVIYGTTISYSSGFVGIGTAEPIAKLHLADSVATNIVLDGSSNTQGAPGYATRKSRGTIASPTAVLQDDYIGTFGARGYGSTGYSAATKGLIGIRAIENWTDLAQGTAITFETTAVSSTTRLEKMRIDSEGNVGIGVSAPVAKLHIAAGTSSTTAFKLTSGTLLATPAAGAVEYDGFNLYYTDGTNTRRTVATDASGVTSSAIASALGYTPANSSTVTSLSNTVATLSATVSGLSGSSAWTASGSTINFSNNVGIGTTNPLAKLDVSGTARISGQVLLGNNPATGGVFDFGTLFGTPTSPYNGPFFLQETATDLSAAHTIGHGVSLKLDSSVDSSGLVFAGLDYLQVAPGNTSAYASLYGRLTAVENRTSGNVSEITGLSAFLLQTGSGTVFQTNALTARSLIYGGSVQSNFGGYFSAVNVGGQVTNNYGAYIDSAFGSIANNYGLFINDQSAVAASQTYNIYSAGSNASNVFRGRVGIGLDLPTARLHLSAGSTSLAPLKLSTGPLLISPQSGSIEYNGFNLFYTDSSNVRQTVATEESLSALSTTVASLAAVVSAGGTSQWTTSGAAITFSGNVGIGLTDPAAALDVSGQLAAGSRHTWLGGNLGGLPIPGDATLLGTSVLGWNASNGSGETNLINAKGPGSPGGFTFDQWDGTSRTTRMMIHGATGFVGIGTTNPTQLLDVSGTAQANKFLVANGAFNNPSIAFSNSPTTGFYNNGGNLGISISGALKGTWSTSSLGFNAGGAGPQINFTGGNEALPSYAFNVDSDTGMFNPNASGGSNELGFSTSGTEKLRILSTGNVGIATSAALGKLDIAWGGASGLVGGADLNASTRTNNTNKWFRYSQVQYANATAPFLALMTGATATENGVYFGGGTALQPNATVLRFYTGTSLSTNGSAVERMTVLPSGNIGIGTTAPNASLQVSGTGIIVDSGTTAGYGSGIKFMNTSHKHFTAGVRAGDFVIADTSAVGTQTWATTPLDRFVINSTGSIGMGTSAPTASLSLLSTNNINSGANLANGIGAMRIQDGTSIGLLLDSNQIEQMDPTNSLYLNHNSSASTILNWGGGYVGVGTLTPTAKFDISAASNTMISNGQGATFRISNPSSANSDYFQVGWISEDNWGIMTADSSTHRNLVVTPWGGNLGVGNTNPTYKLDVTGDIRITGTPYRASGDIVWTVPSDARLKDVIATYDRGLREIASIDTIVYKYKKNNPKQADSKNPYTGVLAQQVQTQIPEAVSADKDGFLSLNTTPIFWAMVNAIKELYHDVLGIKAENTQLKEQVVVQARKIQSLAEENAAVKARLERIEKALEKTK